MHSILNIEWVHYNFVNFVTNMFSAFCMKFCEDPCEPNPCENGGTCTDGKCKCATGFSGGKCETSGKY